MPIRRRRNRATPVSLSSSTRSPATVTEQLVESLGALGTGNLLGLFQLGSLPGDLTRKNLELFAREVKPALEREFPAGAPVHRPAAAVA